MHPLRLCDSILTFPESFEDVINKSLEKDKKLRYQSAAEIHTDLQRLKRDCPFLSNRRRGSVSHAQAR